MQDEINKYNKYSEVSDYDFRMIEAYIDKPEVTQWYVNAFKRFSANGVDVMKWHWSWWAFFGSVFYLLYRKSYLAAGVLFILIIISGIVPLGSIILWILSGGYAPYFVYKAYKEKRLEVETMVEDDEKRIETMQMLGGANDWAIWLGVIVHVFLWGALFSTLGVMLAMLGLAIGNVQ